MTEKNNLDRSALKSMNFVNSKNKIKKEESEEKKQKFLQVENFNNNVSKCNNFCLKKGELGIKVYWCKFTNKSCVYSNCPKIKYN